MNRLSVRSIVLSAITGVALAVVGTWLSWGGGTKFNLKPGNPLPKSTEPGTSQRKIGAASPIAAIIEIRNVNERPGNVWRLLLAPRGSAMVGVASVLCDYEVLIKYVFRGDLPSNAGTQHVLWYTTPKDCRGRMQTEKAGIWFLRTDKGFVRPVEDTTDMLILGKHHDQVASRVRKYYWKSSRAAILFALALSFRGGKPKTPTDETVRIGFERTDGEYDAEDRLTAASRLWLELTEEERYPLCLELEALGVCWQCARDARTLGFELPPASYVGPRKNIQDYWEDSRLQTSLPLIDRLPNSPSLRNELLLYACSSGKQLRRTAREMLVRRYSMRESAISCPACEN